MKYRISFETKIRGVVTIDAKNFDEAERMAEDMAQDTVNYDELTDGGNHAPDVETEVEDIEEDPAPYPDADTQGTDMPSDDSMQASGHSDAQSRAGEKGRL